ncbi:MAG: transcriptional repressor [Clostridia bacterium]|nr:transcriptional repressor [Clostridia bacterium]
MTKQKAVVLDVVRSAKCHYTAEEVYELAKLILPGISRATVYNNLHALEREEMIRRIRGEDSSDRYDSSFLPHGHLYCTECHSIKDFNPRTFPDELIQLTGGTFDSYELRVRYVCPDCRGGGNEAISDPV